MTFPRTFFTILSSGIRCKWPNQLNRCAFMWFIIILYLINSCNSSFVLILHAPSLSFVGPNISLNTFLSNTINSFFYGSFQDPHFTATCYYRSYDTPVQFQFWFLGDQATFREKSVCIICFISKYYSILDLLLSYHHLHLIPDIYRTRLVLGTSSLLQTRTQNI